MAVADAAAVAAVGLARTLLGPLVAAPVDEAVVAAALPATAVLLVAAAETSFFFFLEGRDDEEGGEEPGKLKQHKPC